MSDLVFRPTPTDRTIFEAVAGTAPALALNTPMFNRFGTVGRAHLSSASISLIRRNSLYGESGNGRKL